MKLKLPEPSRLSVNVMFAAGSGDEHPECKPVLDALLGLNDGTRLVRNELRAMARRLGPALPGPYWATYTLRVHRQLEALRADDDERPPSVVLDPEGRRGVPYEALLYVCAAVLDEKRDELEVAKLRRLRDRLEAEAEAMGRTG